MNILSYALFLVLLCSNPLLAQDNRNPCQDEFHIPICHSGAGASTNSVTICPDFGSLWGHLVQHTDDYIGECITDIEDKVKVYACNAGLRHRPHPKSMCFDYENDDDGVLVESCGDSRNCACVNNTENETQYLRDFFQYSIADYKDDLSGPFSPMRKKAGKFDMNVASDSQGNHVISNEDRLTFNLGSARIGSEYFVDFCWRILDSSLQKLQFKVGAALSIVDDLFNGEDYLNTADVELKWEIYCDQNTSGALSYSQAPYRSSTYMPFMTGYAQINQPLPTGKGCYIRFKMRENEWDFLRPHDLKKVTLLSDINVDLESPQVGGDEPITFCHVEPVDNKNFNCQTRNFQNTEALRIWMQLGHNDHRSWRQNNQHNYRGQCIVEGPCDRPKRNDL